MCCSGRCEFLTCSSGCTHLPYSALSLFVGCLYTWAQAKWVPLWPVFVLHFEKPVQAPASPVPRDSPCLNEHMTYHFLYSVMHEALYSYWLVHEALYSCSLCTLTHVQYQRPNTLLAHALYIRVCGWTCCLHPIVPVHTCRCFVDLTSISEFCACDVLCTSSHKHVVIIVRQEGKAKREYA